MTTSLLAIGSGSSEDCKLSEPMEIGDGISMQLFMAGIDAKCCKEAQAVDNQARLDGIAVEPDCATQARKRGVVNGFDCQSKEAIKCGNETHHVTAKTDKSCCPFLEASFLTGK